MRGRVWARAGSAWGLAGVLALAFGPLATGAQAEESLLADARDDTEFLLVGGQRAPAPGMPEVDLVSLTAVEEELRIVLTLEVAGLDAQAAPFAEDLSYRIRLRHGEAVYEAIILQESLAAGPPTYFAGLVTATGYVIETLDLFVDAASGRLTVEVPRDQILDERGAAPLPGRSIEDIVVIASTSPILGDPLDPGSHFPGVEDRMPEDGEAPGSLPILMGDVQTGDASLTSTDPTRLSNGEATTYAFSVEARNLGAADGLFRLQLEGVPEGWDVRVPVPLVGLAAGEARILTILASTPFGHDHGDHASFRVTMAKDGDDVSRGVVTLGVRYNEIAQPAGHHDTLYLHSAQELGRQLAPVLVGYLNALEDDERDSETPLPAGIDCADDAMRRHHTWSMFLKPALSMGLDLDLARTGKFVGVIEAQRPMLDVAVNGTVVVASAGPVGRMEPLALPDLQAGETAQIELVVTPTEYGDLVPYVDWNYLRLDLQMTSTPGQAPRACTDALTPLLLPGASLQLPLLEYHDPLEFGESSLFADQTLRRTAAPGSILSFAPTMEVPADDVAFEVYGVNADWARIVGATHASFAKGDAPVTIEVAVPDEVSTGERADLVLQATPREGAPSFLRIVVDLDRELAVVDESVEGGDRAKTPGLSFLGILALLFALAAAGRRH